MTDLVNLFSEIDVNEFLMTPEGRIEKLQGEVATLNKELEAERTKVAELQKLVPLAEKAEQLEIIWDSSSNKMDQQANNIKSLQVSLQQLQQSNLKLRSENDKLKSILGTNRRYEEANKLQSEITFDRVSASGFSLCENDTKVVMEEGDFGKVFLTDRIPAHGVFETNLYLKSLNSLQNIYVGVQHSTDSKHEMGLTKNQLSLNLTTGAKHQGLKTSKQFLKDEDFEGKVLTVTVDTIEGTMTMRCGTQNFGQVFSHKIIKKQWLELFIQSSREERFVGNEQRTEIQVLPRY